MAARLQQSVEHGRATPRRAQCVSTTSAGEIFILKFSRIPAEGELLFRGRWRGRGPVEDWHVRDGRLLEVKPARKVSPDFGGAEAIIAPPLLDIQVNGANGIDLQDPALEADRLLGITHFLASRGVGRWVPTLVTMDPEGMEHACRVIAKARAQHRELVLAIPGIHLEGPFISPVDGPRGAHPLAHVMPPDWRWFSRWLKAAAGKVLYTTLAPELPGAIPFIKRCVAAGVRVSLGHHHATAAQIRAAVDTGATLCTHLGNGVMTTLPRHENPLWPQLDENRLSASFIADLHHLPPEVLRVMVRAKMPQRSILVSDCTALAGAKPGRYASFGQEVELGKDGAIRIPGTAMLAGSANTLEECVIRAVASGAFTWSQALDAASLIPARALGIETATARPRLGGRIAGGVFA